MAEDTPLILIILVSLILFTSFVSLVGNFILLLSFYKARKLMKKNSLLIIVQAVWDFLASAACIEMILATFIPVTAYGVDGFTSLYCINVNAPFTICLALSQAVTLCLGVERFLAIRCPVWYRGSPKYRFLKGASAACGVLVLSYIPTVYLGTREYSMHLDECNMAAILTPLAFGMFTFLQVGTAVSLAVLYIWGLRLFKRRMARFNTESTEGREHLRQEARIRKTVSVIINTFFFFAAFPLLCFVTYSAIKGEPFPFMDPIAILGVILNMASTMVICFWRNKEAKRGLKLLFGAEANSVDAGTGVSSRRGQQQGVNTVARSGQIGPSPRPSRQPGADASVSNHPRQATSENAAISEL